MNRPEDVPVHFKKGLQVIRTFEMLNTHFYFKGKIINLLVFHVFDYHDTFNRQFNGPTDSNTRIRYIECVTR